MMNDMESAPEGGMNDGDMKAKMTACMEKMESAMAEMKECMAEMGMGDEMMSAQKGYDRKARPGMGAPNPDGLFGE